MLHIPSDILEMFDRKFNELGLSLELRGNYRKWLRYYLEFCRKYPCQKGDTEQVRMFL